jgi:glycosyltransferase involved in cell wall biosynthesis
MLAPGKVYGAEILLRAFARVRESLPRARLVLYGAGTASRELAALAEQLCGPCASAVHGLGELARPSALALIAASDAFVRPTLADGDSVSVREALGLGRRVVATSVGTRPAGVHLVPPGDDLQLARGIIEALAQDPPRDPDSGVDAFARLLSLYRTAHAPEGAPMEDRCAASAAS